MKYEFREEDLFRLARFIGAETKEDGEELQFKFCPYCRGGRHYDKYTFAVNRKSGAFNCLRNSCGKQGHFVQLARDLNFALDFGIPEREYRRLPQREIRIKPQAARHLAKRGISEAVCEKYKITVREDNSNILVFPFLDERGELVSAKYRKTDFRPGIDKNKEWFEAGTKPILFGMAQATDFTQPLIITEGQIDALSLAEAGLSNTVSVPNGCMAFTWVSNCFDWVNQFPSLTVMGDCEKGRLTLVEKIAKSFKKPVYYVPAENYYGLKDANDILQEYGPEVLRESVETAKEYIIPHVKRLADVESVDFSTLPRILSGIPALDRVLGGFYFGQVILLTGRRGEGKSTFLGQLVLEAIEQGQRVLAYSGELTASHFKNWLDFQAAGSAGIENIGNDDYPVYRLKEGIQQQINDWYRPYALIYDNESIDDEDDDLLTTIEEAIIRYGVNMVCLDNLMTAMDVSPKDDFYRAQSEFVRQLKKMALRYNVVIVLVAHPRKETGGKLDNDSVSGSADITNRVDTVLIYSRDEDENGVSGGLLRVSKNRINGHLIIKDPIRLIYSASSKRITPRDYAEQKHYGWEKWQPWVEEDISQTELPF